MKIVASIIFLLTSVCGFSQDWQDNYEKAVSKAKDQNKPIVLVFAGSDWCTPCIKLDKTIWSSEEFKSYATSNYVLYKADFPRKKGNQLPKKRAQLNAALADRFNPQGHFPLVVILDSNEKVLGKTGYKKITPKEYISLVNDFVK